jgi:hypothetical protein
MNGIQPRAGDTGAGVHALAVDSNVKPARSYAKPGAVQPEIQPNAGHDTDGTTETKAHGGPVYHFGRAGNPASLYGRLRYGGSSRAGGLVRDGRAFGFPLCQSGSFTEGAARVTDHV